MCLPFLFHFTKQMYILLIGLNDIWMREIDCAYTQFQKMSSYWVSDLFKYAWEQNMAHNCKFLILWLCFIESHTSRGKNIVENRLLIRLRWEACDWPNGRMLHISLISNLPSRVQNHSILAPSAEEQKGFLLPCAECCLPYRDESMTWVLIFNMYREIARFCCLLVINYQQGNNVYQIPPKVKAAKLSHL